MKNWFISLNGAVTLTALTIFSEAWRGFLDAMFVFPIEFNDPFSMQAGALIFAIVFGVWAWALALAWQGSRRALILTFSINLLVLFAIPVSWLFVYCPASCQAEAGIFNLANTLNLVLGVLAAISMSFHLRRKSTQTVAAGSSD
jgi:hypothetical protein